MNKFNLFILLCSLSLGSVSAQSLSPQVVASSGNYIQAGNYSISYTVGEAVINTLSTSGNTLNQGFHQTMPIATAIKLLAKVYLQGAYNGSTLNTTLSTVPAFPLSQPYNIAPWNYTGAESVVTLPPNVVDWVYVELRDASFNPISGGERAVFLLANGTLLDTDGTAGATFTSLAAGNYYAIIRHRNHVAVMSALQIALPNASNYDFTTAATQAYGGNQQKALGGGSFGMYSGDFNADGIISVSDYNLYQANSSLLNVYNNADTNLDKHVTIADFNLYLPNASIIGTFAIRY